MDSEHLESLYPATSREKEIKELLSFVKEGNSLQLIGLPGVGRANLLGFLAYNRNVRIHHLGEKGQLAYHFILCNFSEVKNRPVFDVMKFLFLEMTGSLHERNHEEEFLFVDKLFKDALSYQDELVLFQAFKEAVDYLSLEKKLTLVFLFERFETFTPQATEEFFNNLRSIRNRVKYKCCFVFSTNRPLEDMLEPSILSDFYEFIANNHVYMSLEDTAGTLFRIRYLEHLTGKKIRDKTVSSLLALAHGHGKLTRLGLETVLGNNILEGEVDESLLLEQKTIQSALSEIWHFLTPDEEQDILHICRDGSCPDPNKFLQKIHLLEKDNITIPLFEAFAKNILKTMQEKAVFSFDQTTSSIKRNAIVISDRLTLSEFRLFRLLLENPDTIVNRENIVEAVWSDNKTREGVSEQALDQLILRLRKKIEDDPTNPVHIQTVKGRGLKFTR